MYGADSYEGADDTGVVTVVVNRSGIVFDVVVSPVWREKVTPVRLGPALGTAANRALSARLADEIEHAEPEREASRVTRPDARDAFGDPSSAVSRELRAEIAGLLAALDRDLETYRRELREATNATVTGRSRKGAVEVTVGHGREVRVTVDPRWAKSAGHGEVRSEALAALKAAHEWFVASSRMVTPPASTARLLELAGDPAALSRELGLS